ncbi:unnamed protein product [Ceutorhynchus assimilis]|uniref:ARF7 effector protein C-terminal domain-containing protein n=1 Tax=Ceutorhynchus assimilis TaxID=467358 RepID=A0A9N9QQ12_9CUCU|nr:unnamed protein product [Ceutorhynchus assimilis]
MNSGTTSSEDENYHSNGQDHPRQRPAKKYIASRTQSTGYSRRRKTAERASKAILALATCETSSDEAMDILNPDINFHASATQKPFPPKKIERPVYDEKGIHISTGIDLCDCLSEQCAGCFFNCIRCGSPKCGTTCRVHRTFVIDYIKYEGYEDKMVKNLLNRKLRN